MKRFLHIRYYYLSLPFLFTSLFGGVSFGQTATFSTSGTWTCPAGVTSVNIQSWGGGGAGGGVNANNSAGAGGGGGAFNSANAVAVTAGTMYNVTVGLGGAGTVAAVGTAGGNSFFNINTATANGGGGGSLNSGAGGAGGSGGGGMVSGGSGAVGGSSVAPGSGGGGGSAGTGAGGTSPGFFGGVAGAGGGAIGAAGWNAYPSASVRGNPGIIPGSGGGGGRKGNGGDPTAAGGAGARGQLTITWACPSYNLLTDAATAGTACQGGGSLVTLISGTLLSGTYTVTYDLSAPNAATGNVATMTFTAGSPGTGTFTTSNLANSGATTVTVTNLASGSVTGTVAGQTNCNTNITTNNTATITVNAPPSQPSLITGSSPVCAGTSQVYSVTNVGGVTYTWNTPSGWPITAGQGTNSVTYTVGPSATISVTPSQASCNGTLRTGIVTTTGIAPGTYTVGPTGNYTSITAVLSQLSACALTGAYIFELQSTYVSTVETFPLTIPLYTGSSAVNTVTFRPQTAGSNRIITGAVAACLIDLNAARYIIFDGRAGGIGTGKDLTIINTNTAWFHHRFQS